MAQQESKLTLQICRFCSRLGQQIPINDPTIFAGDRNWELKMKLDKAISFRPEFRAEIEAKAEAWRVSLLTPLHSLAYC
jgi:hypothetical protein